MKHLLLMTGTLLLSGSLTALADGLPHQGMTMRQVESSFGEPKEKLPPVGHPPISRWLYGSYTVYFDHTAVITTVINGHAAAPAAPAAMAATGTLDFKPIPVVKPDQMQSTDDSANAPAPAPAPAGQ